MFIIKNMSEKMDPRLEEAMERLGGKIGNLDFLRGVPGINRHLVPSVSLGMRRRLNAGERYALEWLACDFFETDKVIVRTSDPDDFWGLIDAMPTKIGKLTDVDRLIEEVRAECRDPRIVGYSIREGGHYDPSRVTTSVAPLINGPRGLVTEHPNLPDVTCVDLVYGDTAGHSGNAHSSEASHVSVDFLGDNPLHIYGEHSDPSKEARKGLELGRLVRGSDAYSDSVALQYEYGMWKDLSLLYQVKGFAYRRDTPRSPEEIRAVFDREEEMGLKGGRRGFRNFGITNEDGLVLPCPRVKGQEEKDPGQFRGTFRNFEEKNPGVDYAAFLSSEGSTHPLTLKDYFSYMKAYLPMPKPPLSHQNTRLAQICLKRGGVAFLNNPSVMECDGADYVRVVADGLHSSVERVLMQ